MGFLTAIFGYILVAALVFAVLNKLLEKLGWTSDAAKTGILVLTIFWPVFEWIVLLGVIGFVLYYVLSKFYHQEQERQRQQHQ